MKPFPLGYASYVTETIEVLHGLDLRYVQDIADEIYRCWQDHTTLFMCGNGGSSSVASHMCVDLSKGLYGVSLEHRHGVRCECLTDNTPTMTAWSNDDNYIRAMADMICCNAKEGDALIVFSGSGNSKNILNALEAANNMGVVTLGVLGFGGGLAKVMCRNSVIVPSYDMQICEDLFSVIVHMIYRDLKSTLSGGHAN